MTATSSTAAITAPFRQAIQVGVVVRDLEKSMAALTGVFGVGPFRVAELPLPERQDQQFYDGRPASFRARQAFADLGSVELELIQPLLVPSPNSK